MDNGIGSIYYSDVYNTIIVVVPDYSNLPQRYYVGFEKDYLFLEEDILKKDIIQSKYELVGYL